MASSKSRGPEEGLTRTRGAEGISSRTREDEPEDVEGHAMKTREAESLTRTRGAEGVSTRTREDEPEDVEGHSAYKSRTSGE